MASKPRRPVAPPFRVAVDDFGQWTLVPDADDPRRRADAMYAVLIEMRAAYPDAWALLLDHLVAEGVVRRPVPLI